MIPPEKTNGEYFYDEETDRILNILESVASQYQEDSDEALAIAKAAMAVTHIHNNKKLRESYKQLLDTCGGELTEEQKERLRRMGIEPDDFEEDE